MLSETGTDRSLGADIRAIRKSRGVRLEDVAQALDKSVGWISQVERDISRPSDTDLRDIARVLQVPVSLFFANATAPANEAGRVVRAGNRRAIRVRDGLIESLLSPDLTDDFEVVHSVFEPGARITEPVTRQTQEVAYFLSGAFRIRIGSDRFDLGPGDSFRLRGEPYTWENPGQTPTTAIWVISPPVY